MSAESSRLADAAVRPLALLDRDGVLIRDMGYVHRPDQIIWIDGIFTALVRLREAGYRVVVVTNQSGVGRGFFTEADVMAFHEWMLAEIRRQAGDIDAFFYCPHHPEATVSAYRQDHEDRKPRPGMLLKAMARFPTDRTASFMIGDRQTDLAAADAAGLKGYLFAGGRLDQLVERILAGSGDPFGSLQV